MRLASKRLMNLYQAALAPTGLKMVEYAFLTELCRVADVGLNELGGRFMMDRSTLRYRLLPMVEAGLIEIAENKRDRRGRRVCATEAGRTRHAEAQVLWSRAQDRFEATIGDTQADSLRAILRTLGTASFAEAFGSP